MLFSVDSGKENTKYLSNGGLGAFKTKISIDEEIIRGVDSNTYNIVVNNTLYKIGDTGAEYSYEISKDKDIHRIAIFTALSKLKPHNYNGDVHLVTGTPINLFFTEERDKIKHNLLGKHSVIFNNNVVDFNITKVLVVPETMGVIYNHFTEYKGKLVKVIDIGGLNANGCIYRNGVPIRESIFTVNYGVNILINKVKNELNKGGFNYQSYEVEYLLKKGTRNSYENDIIDSVCINHLAELQQILRANNWNIDTGDLIFTGGGSDLLTRFIGDSFSTSVISNDGLYDNVKGFYKIGESLL